METTELEKQNKQLKGLLMQYTQTIKKLQLQLRSEKRKVVDLEAKINNIIKREK